MRPSTAVEVLTAVHHKIREVDHEWSPGCCGAEAHDRLEAKDIVDALASFGAHVAFDVALRTEAPSGKRETSRKAAASIADMGGAQRGVYELVACHGSHGLTDGEINRQYPGFAKSNGFPQVATDSPRKRRQSLTDAGYLAPSGRFREDFETKREQIVWVARSDRAVAA